MRDARIDEPGPADPDRLNGWKEIAAFLGKGVRTAQRWEKEYGLPVSRIGREGGEIIFASRKKLTDWLETGAGRMSSSEAGHPEPPDRSADSVPSSRPGRRALWLAAVPALALVGWLAMWSWTTAPAQPHHWRVIDDRLTVYSQNDRLLFEFPSGVNLDEREFAMGYAAEPGGLVAIRDLDGDGLAEVVLAAVDADRHADNAFVILNHDGSVRNRIRPQHVVRFGGTAYAPPWLPHRVFVSDTPGGLPRVHLVFIHGMNFPSLLLEVDAAGNTVSEYWSNGYVTSVRFISWHGFRVLAVGAANNDLRGASLALFESGRARGSAPAENAAYSCANCPAGEPTAFLVFPRRCLAESTNDTGSASSIWSDAQGSIFVTTSEGRRNEEADGHWASQVAYTLDENLIVLKAEPTSGMVIEHDWWHREGRVDHPLSPERDGPDLFPVRRWTENGFIDLPPGRIDWSGLDRREVPGTPKSR